MKNLLLLAGASILALALFWILRADGSRRGSAPRPASTATEPQAPAPSATELSPPAAVRTAQAQAPSTRTATEPAGPGSMRRLAGNVLVQGVGAPDPQAARVAVYARGELQGECSTAAGGAFALSLPVPAEFVVLRIEAEGFASLERDLGNQLASGDLALGTLWLQPGVPLEGLVVDPSGAPVAGADVRLTVRRARPSEFAVGDRTTTDPAGRFRFPHAPAGLVVVTARAAGLGEVSSELRSDQESDLRLVLEAERTLVVRVVAPGGAALAGVDVELRNADPLFPPRKRATGADGRARFEALGAPLWNVLTIARGFRPASLEGAAADGSELVLELHPWPSIAGRLVQPDGAAAPREARVLALPRIAALRAEGLALRDAGEPVGAEGRFRIVDLRPGEYVVRAEAPGFAATLSAPVTVGDEGESSIGDLVLQRGGTLELVLHVRGTPAGGVGAEVVSAAPLPNQIFAPQAAHPPAGATSDAGGKLSLGGLAPGSAWLVLRGPRTVPEVAGPFSIGEGTTTGPIRVELQAGERLVGRVRSAGGEPIPRARMRVSGPGISVPFLEADAAGRFESVPLPPGPYTIEAFPVPGGATTTSSIEVRLEAGEEREIEFRIDA